MAINPNLATTLANELGFFSAINALYFVFIFLLLCFVFYLFMKISELEKKINNLIQRYALDEEKKKNRAGSNFSFLCTCGNVRTVPTCFLIYRFY